MTLNVINGLPTKMKYGLWELDSEIKINEDIKNYYESSGYSLPRVTNTCNEFMEYIVENILKITNYDNSIAHKGDYENVPIDTFYSNDATEYYTDLAGTIYTSKMKFTEGEDDSYLNVAYVIESTTSPIQSHVDVRLRHDNPLMQSIVDCNGTVHDFKKGVTLSDFSKYIKSTTNSQFTEIVTLDGLSPSNVSAANAEKANTVKPEGLEAVEYANGEFYRCDAVIDTIFCNYCHNNDERIDIPVVTVIRSYENFIPFMTELFTMSQTPLAYLSSLGTPMLYISSKNMIYNSVLDYQLSSTNSIITEKKKYVLNKMASSN